MSTFYNLLKELANLVGDTRQGTATGGSTSTLVDTNLIESDGIYNGGTLFIDLGTPAMPRITTWTQGTYTFAFPTLAVGPSVGIQYTAITNRYPLDVLKKAINQALAECGRMMNVDETITIVADQERYTIPTTASHDIRRIELGTENEGNWKIHYHWRIEGGEIRFLANAPSDTSQKCRLHYVVDHASLSALADALDEQIDRRLLLMLAAKYAYLWRNIKSKRDEVDGMTMLNYFLAQEQRAREHTTTKLLNRDPILASY